IEDLVADVSKSGQEEQSKPESVEPTVSKTTSVESTDQIRRTPIARRLAAENNVSLTDIQGTGPLGRIQKADVEKYLEQTAQRITPLAKKMADAEKVDTSNIAGSGVHGKIM